MKKFIILVLTIWAFSVNAQNVFPNAGFETWNGTTLSQWNTLSVMGVNISDVTKSTEANSGSYAVRIAPKPLPSYIAAAMGVDNMIVPGLLTNATIDLNSIISALSSGTINFDNNTLLSVFSNGIALTERPTSVNGFYSWSPVDQVNENFLLGVYVISNQSGTREVIGMGGYSNIAPMKATYTPFQAQIIYQDEQSVPTELIFISLVTNSDSNATSFGHLLLDDVSITTQVGLENATPVAKKLPIIYPNPTSGDFKLNVNSDVEVSVYNQLGQVIIPAREYSPNKTLSVKEKGIYFVRIKDSKGYKTQKLVVK